MIYEYFPPAYLELAKEVHSGYHAELEKILTLHGGTADDIDLKLAQIAAYCEVMLDGVYTLEARIKLCDILREKLILKRANPNNCVIIIN